MTATAFITGNKSKAGKAGIVTMMGAVLLGGMRAASMAKRVENPDAVFSMLPGNFTIAKVLNWAGGKVAGEDGAKVASQVSDAIATPGKVMSLPLEAFAKQGKGSISELMGGKPLTQKMLGENAEEKIAKITLKTSTLGGTISTVLGKVLQVANEKLNLSGKVDNKIAKQEAILAAAKDSLKNFKNQPNFFKKAKQKLGIDIGEYASAQEIAETSNRPEQLAVASVGRENRWNKLSLLEKQNRERAAREVDAKYDAEYTEASKGITDQGELDKIRKEVIDSRTAADKRILRKRNPRGITAEIKQKILHNAEKKTGDKILSGDYSLAVDKVMVAKEDLDQLTDKKKFWDNPTEGIKNRAKDVTISEVADFTMRYGAVAHQAIGMVSSTKVELRTLKQLMADLTGADPRKISTFKALFGKASPLVKEARSQFIKSSLLGMIPLVGGTIAQEVASQKLKRKFGKDNNLVSIGVTAAFGMIQQLSGFMGGDNKMLETYAAARIAEEAGQQLTANDYSSILAISSNEIKGMGGVANHNTLLIAQYYEANNTPVSEVMKDINAGRATLIERSNQGKELVTQYNIANQAAVEVEKAHSVSDNKPLVQGEGKFTANKRNQPASQGSFAEKANASQAVGAAQGIS